MDLNNLNASLHSVISGAKSDANIPFADDEVSDNRKSSESISSNDSSARKAANYRRGMSERRGAKLRLATNHRRPSAGNDSSDESLQAERRDKPGPLKLDFTESSNLGVMRRNSISMPVLNENDLDKLREMHMQCVDSGEDLTSKEELDKITVVSWIEKSGKLKIVFDDDMIYWQKLPEFKWLDGKF